MDSNNMDSTKNRIIEKALSLFQSKGYMNVSVKDICDECGITRGAFYYYYKTKDKILDDIYIASDQISAKEVGNIIQSDNYIEQFYKLHSIYLERTLDMGPEVLGQILKRHIDKGTKLTEPKDIAVYEMYIALIQKAQDAEQISSTAPASTLADSVIHITNSIGIIWCSKKGDYDFKSEFRRLSAALFLISPPII